jgi:hypothetical protein
MCSSLLLALPASAVIPLPTIPDWESNPNNQVATGLGVGDLDSDGWVDLVVANGNDISRQRLAVYRNQAGVYPANPTWTSNDIDYHGHLDLADVDGDGDLDCAVAVYLGVGGFGSPGRVKLYDGLGNGTFSANPIWQSSDSFYCFSVSFGDLDNDGDPDLACATGDDYESNPDARRVYRNEDGALGALPAWTSSEIEYSLDVTWADFNRDGRLDLAFAGTSCPDRVYLANIDGTLPASASWSSADASIWANTAAAGDVDGDGWIDLAIADNNQLGGSGRFKLYRNLGGNLSTTPTWLSNQAGYGSNVSWIDVDEDGDLDLSTGQWWGPVRVYENVGGVLGASPAYTSATASVIENEIWEDVDNDGLQRGLSASWTGDGSRRLFYLPSRPARQLLRLSVAGVPVDVGDVYLDSDDAWLVLPAVPPAGAVIQAAFISSADVDLVLSNWDTGEGEYLFRNQRNPTAVDGSGALSLARLILAPNPSDGRVRISLEDAGLRGPGEVWIVDAGGRRVGSWSSVLGPIQWDGRDVVGRRVAAGVYGVRWFVPGQSPIEAKLVRR